MELITMRISVLEYVVKIIIIIKQVSIENGSDIFLGKFQVFLLCL